MKVTFKNDFLVDIISPPDYREKKYLKKGKHTGELINIFITPQDMELAAVVTKGKLVYILPSQIIKFGR